MAVIQEDRQGFGWLLCNNTNLHHALQYPITSIPLSLANPDGFLRSAPKNLFRNELIALAKATESKPPENARWIVDNMAVLRYSEAKENV